MNGRHVPASHPVLRRRPLQRNELLLTSPDEVHRYTLALDELARLVWLLPSQPITNDQGRMLTVIAHELLRRARG